MNDRFPCHYPVPLSLFPRGWTIGSPVTTQSPFPSSHEGGRSVPLSLPSPPFPLPRRVDDRFPCHYPVPLSLFPRGWTIGSPVTTQSPFPSSQEGGRSVPLSLPSPPFPLPTRVDDRFPRHCPVPLSLFPGGWTIGSPVTTQSPFPSSHEGERSVPLALPSPPFPLPTRVDDRFPCHYPVPLSLFPRGWTIGSPVTTQSPFPSSHEGERSVPLSLPSPPFPLPTRVEDRFPCHCPVPLSLFSRGWKIGSPVTAQSPFPSSHEGGRSFPLSLPSPPFPLLTRVEDRFPCHYPVPLSLFPRGWTIGSPVTAQSPFPSSHEGGRSVPLSLPSPPFPFSFKGGRSVPLSLPSSPFPLPTRVDDRFPCHCPVPLSLFPRGWTIGSPVTTQSPFPSSLEGGRSVPLSLPSPPFPLPRRVDDRFPCHYPVPLFLFPGGWTIGSPVTTQSPFSSSQEGGRSVPLSLPSPPFPLPTRVDDRFPCHYPVPLFLFPRGWTIGSPVTTQSPFPSSHEGGRSVPLSLPSPPFSLPTRVDDRFPCHYPVPLSLFPRGWAIGSPVTTQSPFPSSHEGGRSVPPSLPSPPFPLPTRVDDRFRFVSHKSSGPFAAPPVFRVRWRPDLRRCRQPLRVGWPAVNCRR